MTVSAWRLRDERDFLRRSLDDAAREHEAGDLTDGDYELLRARDATRLAEVEVALADLEAEPAVAPAAPPAPPRPAPRRRRLVVWRRSWWLAAGGLALVVAAAVLLVVTLTSPRLPGQDATGSIDLNTVQQIERQLSQAQALVHQGRAGQALALYGQVLTEDPRQPVALAEWGWLDWQAATKAKEHEVAAEGLSALQEAVRVDPGLAAAQFYLGTVLFQAGQPKAAVAHYARFYADHPSAAWRKDAASEVRAAYAAAGETPPPAADP